MKSTAHFKGHPIHPMLVAFPIAFFTGTFIFDLLGWLMSEVSLTLTGYYLEISGIIGGLLAAVPGLIDYFKTVPPKSSAKKRATKHMLVNVTMLLIFSIALYVRMHTRSDSVSFILLELVGLIFLVVGGWLGGTLVFRNQIGVDIRYANAGKWKKEEFEDNVSRIAIANSDELKVNQMKLIIVGEERIALGRTETGYFAFSDRCTHRGASLAAGSMICGTVQCPWHGSQFDVMTGEVKAGPAKSGIPVYKVSKSGNKIYLERQTA